MADKRDVPHFVARLPSNEFTSFLPIVVGGGELCVSLL